MPDELTVRNNLCARIDALLDNATPEDRFSMITAIEDYLTEVEAGLNANNRFVEQQTSIMEDIAAKVQVALADGFPKWPAELYGVQNRQVENWQHEIDILNEGIKRAKQDRPNLLRAIATIQTLRNECHRLQDFEMARAAMPSQQLLHNLEAIKFSELASWQVQCLSAIAQCADTPYRAQLTKWMDQAINTLAGVTQAAQASITGNLSAVSPVYRNSVEISTVGAGKFNRDDRGEVREIVYPDGKTSVAITVNPGNYEGL